VVVEIPHAGVEVPPRFMAEVLASARAIGKDADLHVDALYGSAHELGATVLVSRVSRYIVDLNRDPSDFDAQAVEGGLSMHSPRGVIWRLTTEGDRALAAPLRRASFEERMNEVYRPYHACLTDLIHRKVARFGVAVVLAAHSMPSLGKDRNAARADIVPGSQGRTSSDARFIDAVDAHAREARFSVAHDEPYKGGYTTRHYGRPAERVHVVQVEIARRLYMDELALRLQRGRFELMRTWCAELVAKLGRAALT
jgi:N-formylglutamate amidohydrolase